MQPSAQASLVGQDAPRPVRLTLLAALCWSRSSDVTVGLVLLTWAFLVVTANLAQSA